MATRLRREFGLAWPRAVLGHASPVVTVVHRTNRAGSGIRSLAR
jgi:hypothetical protein